MKALESRSTYGRHVQKIYPLACTTLLGRPINLIGRSTECDAGKMFGQILCEWRKSSPATSSISNSICICICIIILSLLSQISRLRFAETRHRQVRVDAPSSPDTRKSLISNTILRRTSQHRQSCLQHRTSLQWTSRCDAIRSSVARGSMSTPSSQHAATSSACPARRALGLRTRR